jgi:hypothetical protein
MKKFFTSVFAVPMIVCTFVVNFLTATTEKAHTALFGYMAAQGLVLGAAPMRSTDFRPIVEPILNKVFDGVYEQRKDEWSDVFTQTDGTPRAYHEEPVMFGFGAAPEMPDGTPVTYQQGGVLFNKRYVYRIYGLGYAMTRTLVEDGDHIRLGKIFAQHLAQSLIETKETLTANVLNRGFNASFVGGDGVSLFNAAHPIVSGSFSNLLPVAAALSQTSLEQMLIQIRKAVDNNGKRIRLQNQKLVVSPDNVFQAEVLLKSVLRAGTNNNDINPVKSTSSLDSDPAVITRLSSPTMWGVTTNAPTGLQLVMRAALKKGMEGDFETDSMRFKGTERYDVGWTDPRGMYATPGL